MEKKKIHMIGNTHIDPVWLWDRAEGMQEVKSSFLSALDRMDEFPDFIFSQSSISYLEWMKENCPEAFERIRQRVADGRWEIVGGMWVEPDCDLPSGESLIRHFLYGKGFVEKEFGKEVVTAYNVDSFGHGANLPAICSGCGIRYYLMSRPDKKHLDVPPVFVWKAPSGSRVIAERTGGEYMAWTRPALEQNLKESLEALEANDQDRMAVFYGVGNHGGGPTIENIRVIYEMKQERKDLELDFSTMENFFSQTEPDKLPERCQEMGRIFYGCYSSDALIKKNNRRGEWTLQKAETIMAMAGEMGRETYISPEKELEQAWKEVLFNQFHDVLAGTSIEPARNQACEEVSGAIAQGRKIIRNGVQALANELDTRGEGFPLILYNPSGVPFHGVFSTCVYVPRACKKPLRLKGTMAQELPCYETLYHNSAPESRKGIVFEADVPAYGYSVYRIVSEGPEAAPSLPVIQAEETLLDNGLVRVTFDKEKGCPSSIVMDGKELLGGPCGIGVYYDDRGAWGEDVYKEVQKGYFHVTGCRVIEANGMRAILRYLLAWEQSEMVIDYILERNNPALKMSVRLRNGEKHRQITFDLPSASSAPRMTSETAFLAEHKVDLQDENQEYYHHRFADLSGEDGSGIAVLNNGAYGFRQVGNCYKLILVRSTIFARGGAGPREEALDGGFVNQDTCTWELVLLPHSGEISNNRLFDEADQLHLPLEVLADSNHTGKRFLRKDSIAQLKGENVHFSTIKPAQDGSGDLIFRFFETEGKDGSCTLECRGFNREETLSPWEIKTLRLTGEGFVPCDMLERPEKE